MSTITSETASESSSPYSTSDGLLLTPSKSFQKLKATTNNVANSMLYGTDNLFNVNLVGRELECQICLSQLENPVFLPCSSHSLCFGCISSLFKHQKRGKDGRRSIYCPSCGIASGIVRVKKAEHLKINRELERVQKAYEKERTLWVEEKLQLETQLNCIKNKEEEMLRKKEEAKKKSLKKGLSSDEELCLKRMLENFNAEKLKEASMLILENMKVKEKSASTPTKRRTRQGAKAELEEQEEDSHNKASESRSTRSTSQRGIWLRVQKNQDLRNNNGKRKNTVDVDELEKREYPLRGLKKTRTSRL